MLTVVRADSGDRLADALAARLREPVGDPLAPEEIMVHSRGMERWLSQHLSRHLGTGAGTTGPRTRDDGIAANLRFPFPAEVVRRAVRAVGGPDPSHSAWDPDRLVWQLVAVGEDDEGPWTDHVRARIADDPDARLAVLRTLADRYDHYAVHRPDLVLRWLAGDDVDAAGQPLPAADRWQPALLRALRDRVDEPTLAESATGAVAALATARGPLPGLPPRLAMFGFTALPATHLAILAATARLVDLDLYLLHPSSALWDRWADLTGTLDAAGLPVLPLRADLAADTPRNPLLASWGRDAAEVQVVVATAAPGAAQVVVPPLAADRPASALRRLQQSIRDDADPGEGGAVAVDGARSLQIHAAPGRTRQVQVLRDELLRLLAADPTLRPRDVIVMCPDVEEFAPLVNAHLAVGEDDPDGRPDLRVRLADRSLRQLNPLLRATDDVLALACGRVAVTDLLDLAGREPVRRRFGIGLDDLERLEELVLGSGMRWGLDAADRHRDGVVEMAGSVRAGLSRMLLGVAMADEDLRTVGAVTPLDDVDGGDVVLVGRFAELCGRLADLLARMRTPMPASAWAATLVDVADLLLREPADEPWQRAQLTELAAQVGADAGDVDVPVTLAEIRALLADRLKGQPSWANHRTGDLTVCTLVPMRSVPHRVVCLLGMDDEVFPRRTRPAADDLLARHPRIGDRDPRTEDRQLLLDAVMAATDAVVITYSGVDERTGEPRPPCVPVAELERVLDRCIAGGAAAVTTTHPLNAHDPRAFTPSRPGFDPQAHRAATVVAAGPVPPPPPAAPIDVTPPAEVELDRLIAFCRDPAAHFYRRTVGAWVPEDPEIPARQVPLTVSGLAEWELGEALLSHDAVGDEDLIEQIVRAMRGRGTLPPTPLDERKIEKAVASAADIAGFCARLDVPAPAHLDGAGRREIRAVVGDRVVTGAVDDVVGDRHVMRSYSKVKAKQMVAAWVRLLALTADDPSRPWEVLVVGRHEREKQAYRNRPHAVRFPPLGEDEGARRRAATAHLDDLLALHDAGLREPLVAPAATAAAYAIDRVIRRRPPAEADDAAAARWDHRDFSFDCESANPAHVLRHGDVIPYDALRGEAPRDGDVPPGREPEPHRFGALALRIWSPLLTHCRAVRP
ncbi:exodeoxyribonuclease V subunit gamma [Euzebya sp.]|uniref:exodeoxyribonuclease V subunit gamma n=1 Tax=Euzebya sp. TaxID=1971409 RepID=UPI00355A01C4